MLTVFFRVEEKIHIGVFYDHRQLKIVLHDYFFH